MRLMTTTVLSLLVAAPLMCIGAPARADNNDWMGQAQQFLNNRGNDQNRDAYERGREDEMRRQQADQDRYRYRRNDDDRDLSRDDRYRQPDNGYSNNER